MAVVLRRLRRPQNTVIGLCIAFIKYYYCKLLGHKSDRANLHLNPFLLIFGFGRSV